MKPIITMIMVTDQMAVIGTSGLNEEAIQRQPDSQLWQWHEAIASAVANHHASAMGALLPCPLHPNHPDAPGTVPLKREPTHLSPPFFDDEDDEIDLEESILDQTVKTMSQIGFELSQINGGAYGPTD